MHLQTWQLFFLLQEHPPHPTPETDTTTTHKEKEFILLKICCFRSEKINKRESVNKAGFTGLVLDRSVNTQQPSYLFPNTSQSSTFHKIIHIVLLLWIEIPPKIDHSKLIKCFFLKTLLKVLFGIIYIFMPFTVNAYLEYWHFQPLHRTRGDFSSLYCTKKINCLVLPLFASWMPMDNIKTEIAFII